MPPPYTVGGIKRCCYPSVCLSRFLFFPVADRWRYMHALPFHMHSKGGSTIGYALIQMYIASLCDTLLSLSQYKK